MTWFLIHFYFRDDVAIRSVEYTDIEEIAALWKTDNWDFGIDILYFILDPRLCNSKNFVAVYDGKIIGNSDSIV